MKGENRQFILQKIKDAGIDPKALKALADSIQYVGSRAPEYEDVLDLYEDISRLWETLIYYLNRLVLDSDVKALAIGDPLKYKNAGRIADISCSEKVFGKLVILLYQKLK